MKITHPTEEQIKRRDDLMAPFMERAISGRDYGIAYYSGLDNITLQTLIDEGYADPEERQNDSPEIQVYQDFISEKTNLKYRLHGYVVSPKRDDYRVSIEGMTGAGLTLAEILDAVYFERHADELSFNTVAGVFRSWWD